MKEVSNIRNCLALVLGWFGSTAGATSIVEMSQTHDFSDVVVNGSGQTAYFATPLDEPDDLGFDPRAIHRDGGVWVTAGGAFKEVDGPLLISDTGTVVFSGFQGEFQLPDAQGVDGGTLEEVGGVYRGGNPSLPADNQACVTTGDSLWSCGNSDGGTPLAHAPNGDFLLTSTPTSPRVRFPFPRGCSGDNLDPDDVFASVPASNRVIDINGTLAAGFVDDFRGTFLTLAEYPDCGPNYDDQALRQSTMNVFRSISSLKLGEGVIYLNATRDTAGGSVRGIYSISFDGTISSIMEMTPGSGFVPEGVTKSGGYFLRDRLPSGRSAWFFSDSGEPLLAAGHQIGGYIWRGCTETAFSDTGIMACIGELEEINNPGERYNAVIIADGSTDFPPDPDEPEPDIVFWDSENTAAFFDESSWDPQTIPDSDQIAVFASVGGSDVAFEGQTANSKQLRVEKGFFQFLEGTYQLNTGSAASPSLLLQPGTPGDIATLTIAAGHRLQTRFATIDQNTSVGGLLNAVFIDGDRSISTPQNRWDNESLLVVDGNLGVGWSAGLISDSTRIGSASGSSGEISIGDVAESCAGTFSADLGTTWVGYAGEGNLLIEGCTVAVSGERIVGAQQGAVGTVEIDQGTWGTVSSLPMDLTVGQSGSGLVSVRGGALSAENLILGHTVSGAGDLSIEAPDANLSGVGVNNELIVGNAGIGRLMVMAGGLIIAESMVVGAADYSVGEVHVNGEPLTGFANVEINGDTIVGLAGNGELNIADNGQVKSNNGSVGVAGRGTVRVSDAARWHLVGNLNVGLATDGSNSDSCDGDEQTIGVGTVQVLGDGQTPNLTGQILTISGPDSMLSGTGLAVFSSYLVSNCAQLSPGNSPGTLFLNGDLQFSGGVLVIEVAGVGPGQFDVLNVSGDATLSGGIVRFVFDDFLPQQGDQIRFFEMENGSSTISDLQYEYVGADPDFEFTVVADDVGNLLFTADNNATFEIVFSNGFE